MKLYHYASEEFDDLRSRLAQGKKGLFIIDRLPALLDDLKGPLADKINKVMHKDEWSYERSISFFIDPIPLDIAKIFNDEHEYWISGRKLVQYEVNLTDLPPGVGWRLVESPEKTRLLYEHQDWEAAKKDKDLIAKFVQEIKDKEKSCGYIGHGWEDLNKVISKFDNKTKRYFKEAAKIAFEYPEDNGLQKYAACVPHVMTYPGYKPIEYSNITNITLK